MAGNQVENPMVTGAGFPPEREREAQCPHCGALWGSDPQGGFWDGPLWAPAPLTFSGRFCLDCAAQAAGPQALRAWFAQEGREEDLFRFFLGDPAWASQTRPQEGLLPEEARLLMGLLRDHEPELFTALLEEYAQSPLPGRRAAWLSYLWAVC